MDEKKTYFQSGDSWLRRRALTFSPKQPSIASLDQRPHKKAQNKSMHRVEMNPKLYRVSLGDPWAFETYSHTCSLVQLLLTEPSLPVSRPLCLSLSLLHADTLHVALTSQSVALQYNLNPHTHTHTHIFTCTQFSLHPACPFSSPSSDSRLDSQ